MGYTEKEILDDCKKAFYDKNTFYNQRFINYRGKTTDTDKYYTEIIAKFLCANIEDFSNGIDCITRQSPYKVEGHDGQYDPNSNREEEKLAMDFFNQSRDYGPFNFIGKIEDYQTPLKSSADDEAGKIDLLSCDGEIMRILELKRPDNTETMLRCVLEGYTYLKIVDNDKLIKDFRYEPQKVILKASPLVFYGGEQHKEMFQNRPNLRKLMEKLNCEPYYYTKNIDGKYVIVNHPFSYSEVNEG